MTKRQKCGPYCCAVECHNARGRDNTSFHYFPKDEQLKQIWLTNIHRDQFQPSAHSVVCGQHFSEECFITESSAGIVEGKKRRLTSSAVPTIFPKMPPRLQKVEKRRSTQNSNKPLLAPFTEDIAHDCELSAAQEEDSKSDVHKECKLELQKLKRRNRVLTKRLRKSVSYSQLEAANARITIYKNLIKKKNAEILSLRQRLRRLRLKNKSLNDLMEILEKKSILRREEVVDLKKHYQGDSIKLLDTLVRKNIKVKKYSEEVRRFASTLHFYSPRAYLFIRKYFNIPHPSTLRAWLSNFQCNPGFCEPAFEQIRLHYSQDPISYEYCSLVADEISLKKHVSMDRKTGSFFGYVDKGNHVNEEEEATSALVLMLVGLKKYWKLPIGYFLVNGVRGKFLHDLIHDATIKLFESGIKVVSVTMDGTYHNITAFELLGAKISSTECKPFFPHPSDPDLFIVTMLDPPHMLKLVRNSLESLKTIVWKDKGNVQWSYIEKLQQFQKEHDLFLANKLTERHVNFHNQKMKVNLAAQLLSSSVAKSLRLLHQLRIHGFTDNDVLTTADFLDLFNNLFDSLNSRKLKSFGFKRGITLQNKDNLFNYYSKSLSEILRFETVAGRSILLCPKKTGFLGIFSDVHAVIKLSNFLLSDSFSFFLTYKLSQDFLEIFFNAIRLRNGWSHNPTPVQFKYAFRQLLLHAGPDILQSTTANATAQDPTKQLTLSLDVINSSVANSFSSAAEEDSTSSVNELFSDNQGFLPSTTHCVTPLRCLICRNIVYYIAGFIVRKMNKVIKCQTCLQVLFSSRNTFLEASLVNIKMYNIHSKGGLIYTSWDVLNVLLHTETLFRKVSQIRKNFSHGEILNSVMKSSSHFFVNLDEHSATISSGIESHKLHLIKCLVSSFLILRMHKHAKVASQNLSQSGKRQKLSRSIIYQNL